MNRKNFIRNLLFGSGFFLVPKAFKPKGYVIKRYPVYTQMTFAEAVWEEYTNPTGHHMSVGDEEKFTVYYKKGMIRLRDGVAVEAKVSDFLK